MKTKALSEQVAIVTGGGSGIGRVFQLVVVRPGEPGPILYRAAHEVRQHRGEHVHGAVARVDLFDIAHCARRTLRCGLHQFRASLCNYQRVS